jgi:hypothetical protein
MDHAELIQQIKQLMDKTRNPDTIIGVHAEVSEFLRTYAGANSSFYESIQANSPGRGYNHAAESAYLILKSFLHYVDAGLHQGISPERRTQLDVVSDFLEMANTFFKLKTSTLLRLLY